jgi:amidase
MNEVTRRGFLAKGMVLGSAAVGSTGREGTPGAAQPRALDLEFSSALHAADAIRRGRISSVELTGLALDRIRRLNPSLKALAVVDEDAALADARIADRLLASGSTRGSLHGVPVTIKDAFEVAGLRTTAGSPALRDHVPSRDSPAVARLRAAGAVILGNTNVPFMLGDLQSYNEIYGTTRNPWDLSRTSGGSSGGSAAALAAGLGHLSLGSDLAGSIRIPAHFCGVYGHKPTADVIPRRGSIPPLPGTPPQPSAHLAVGGPMARSAADLEAALEILGGPDGDDAAAWSWRLPPARGRRLTDHRVGYVLDDPHCRVTAEVEGVLARSVESLRQAGLRLEEGWPDGVDPRQHYETYRYLLSACFAWSLEDEKAEEVRARGAQPENAPWNGASRAWTDPHKDFQEASSERLAARAAWQEYFRSHDAFLMPASFVTAFPHDHSEPQEKRSLATPDGPRAYPDLMFWPSFATLAGLPATTAPLGVSSSGLPVGIQIVGPYLEDATPIHLAEPIADVIGGFRAPSGY